MRILEETPAPAKRRPWTTKELAYVREHYPMQGGKKVGEAIGRPAASVCEFARRHGIGCLNQVGVYTLDSIQARCEVDTEGGSKYACWVWTGRIHEGVPYGWHGGSLGSMRKVAFSLHHGREVAHGHVVKTTCECGACLNPFHLKEISRRELLRENHLKEPAIRRSARLTAAAVARGNAVLNLEKAREIRASCEPARVFAERFGVSESHINRVRRGESWKEYSAGVAAVRMGS